MTAEIRQPADTVNAHGEDKKPFWSIFLKPSVISVFIMVLGWNYLLSSTAITHYLEGTSSGTSFEDTDIVRETIREFRDLNLNLQMRLYQMLFEVAHPVRETPDNVRLVYIDDETHWKLLKGVLPTKRDALASIITNLSAAKTNAAVIGIDIELLATMDEGAGKDASERLAADGALADAIRTAARNKVPVVLAAVYEPTGDTYTELPNIYPNAASLVPQGLNCAQDAACPTFGYINLPDDKRQVPIELSVSPSQGAAAETIDSFAEAVAKAFRDPVDNPRKPLKTNASSEKDERTFGRFLPESQFTPVSFADLLADDAQAENQCRSKIVLIGGHWHDFEGHGKFIDQHLSPAGEMSGLALHANYVEALLQKQTAHEWPTAVDVVIDIVFGLAVYALFELAHQWWKIALLLLGIALLPILVAYFSLVTLNVYLDFVLPVELYFLHIVYEISYETVKEHFKERAQAEHS